MHEVVLIFDNKVLRGNRSKKLSPNKVNAFGSPNLAPLGKFGIEFEYNIYVNQDTKTPTTKYQKLSSGTNQVHLSQHSIIKV